MTNVILNSIVDSHQHFWRLDRGDYDWLNADITALYRDYLPNDLMSEPIKLKVPETVVIQAAATNQETDFLLGLANKHEFIRGVVGWLDMTDYPANIDRLTQLAKNPKLKGIRPMLQEIADPDWILNPLFQPVFEKLIELDLSFDALINTAHLESILRIAKQYPLLRIVINHCAKPDIANHSFKNWARKLAYFQDKKNVFIKVSGLTTEASQNQQSTNSYRRYFQHVYKTFGAHRMMWGSDWPVVNLNSDYQKWLHISTMLSEHMTESELNAFFIKTASSFYKFNQS